VCAKHIEDIGEATVEEQCKQPIDVPCHSRLVAILGMQPRYISPPSALLLLWIAQINTSLERVCDTSPKMWKMLNAMLRDDGYTELLAGSLGLGRDRVS
jgi:hypothetical protein